MEASKDTTQKKVGTNGNPKCSKYTSRRNEFARFRRLYESRDGGLCLFEDEQGRLTAVDASRLV